MLLHLIGMPAPHQASPTALSERVLLTTPTMTSLIDRLEAFGYVERRPDPTDRRGILVQLTENGTRVALELQDEYVALETRILAPLDTTQRETLIELLRALILACESDGWRDSKA
jgi:DNA-binding MarR family transcriptional regulator